MPWFIAEQGKDIFARVPVDLASFWRRTHSPPGTRRFSTHIHRNAIIRTVCSLTMRVEFLGVPRQRAGISQLEVQADTLAQLLGKLSAQIPLLGELIAADRLHPSLVANLNGDRFVSDPSTPLNQNDCVLILSADAGG
jgi:molybdopterin converting factor small subunit